MENKIKEIKALLIEHEESKEILLSRLEKYPRNRNSDIEYSLDRLIPKITTLKTVIEILEN